MPSEPPHDRQTIEPRQHYVEHDHIELSGLRSRKTLRTFKRRGRSVSQLVQSFLQLAGESTVVLHNQDLHQVPFSVSRINLKNS
jgi:hypothetical protein